MNKNEELQKWLNDDRYVQVKELAEMWGINISSVGAFLSRNNIKATRILYTGKSVIFAFYDRHKCENARLRLQQKIKGAEDCKSNKMLVPLRELAQLWSISINATRSFLCKHGIKPLKYFHTGVGSDHRAFYDRAECERARPFINQPEQKEVEKVEEKQMELLKNKTIECSNLAARFCGDIAIGRFVMVANELDAKIINEVAGDIICPVLSTQTPQETHDVIKNLIDNNATLLTLGDTDGRLMSIAEAADKGSDIRAIIKFGLTMRDESMPEPKEQVPDIIPADTIDLFTMSELETELKNRGVELTAEVRAKINASDMPEMQHIATMLRGNAKTITIRLSVLNDIAGQLREVKPVIIETKKDVSKLKRISISDAAESAGITREQARYWSSLLGIEIVKDGRVSYLPSGADALLEQMAVEVKKNKAPNVAAAELKIAYSPENMRDNTAKELDCIEKMQQQIESLSKRLADLERVGPEYTTMTEGPWIAVGIMVEHENDKIADVCSCNPEHWGQIARPHAESMANATVIAAVPHMIKLLEKVSLCDDEELDDIKSDIDDFLGKMPITRTF